MNVPFRYARVSFLAFFAALFASATARAELLQILHTNDLHSYIDFSSDRTRGGYPQVKAKLDALTREAASRGIQTVTLDGGDFLEGNIGYLADRGRGVFRAIDEMGYDAVVIGNHDWLMGPDELDEILSEVRPGFEFLGANFIHPTRLKNISRYMKPYTVLERGGARIAVLGLTTASPLYSWRAKEGLILPPSWVAKQYLKKLRKAEDIDHVIALTHIGVDDDEDLAKETHGIDLIVGAHSHTELPEAVWIRNRKGKPVPIVQTGSHGEWVGRILADVGPNQELKLLEYELVPIYSDGPRDPAMTRRVARIWDSVNREYGERWLHETIGYTETELYASYKHPTAWGNFQVDTLREYAGAELALDVKPFSGMTMPPGELSRAKLFSLYPRMFDFDDKFGWSIWTVQVRGWLLGLVLKIAVEKGFYFQTSGVTFDLKEKNGKRKVSNIRIGGKKLKWWKDYDFAMPEGIARGAMGISQALELILKDPKNLRIPIWLALADKLQREKVIRALPGEQPAERKRVTAP